VQNYLLRSYNRHVCRCVRWKKRARRVKAYDARAVANFLLDYADEKRMKVTALWLQKVIFYAHGWYLSKKERPLVQQAFEAWDYGPVVRAVYDAFKGSGAAPLSVRAKRFDVIENTYKEINEPLDAEAQVFLRKIFDAYSLVNAFDLSSMTHAEGSPWDRVWNAPNGAITLGMKISNDEIRKWFSGMQAPGLLH
jgi:uncharacterized phage-associated protein